MRTTPTRMMRRFAGDRAGLAALEFGLVLPLLMTLMYGAIEVTRYILIAQKSEKLSHSVADMASQSQVATIAALNQVLAASSDIMNPYTVGANGRVIVTSIYRAPNTTTARVNWRYEGGGTLTATSQFGAIGSTATMPAGFTFDERENVIAAEVFYRFSPLISSRFFGTTTIYRRAYYKPRFGALINAPS